MSQAWDAVSSMPRGYSRARAFVALALQQRGRERAVAVIDAQAAVSEITDAGGRVAALTALIPQLPRPNRAAAAKDALAAIGGITHPDARAAALTALIPQLPKPRRAAAAKDAQAVIRSISQPEDRAAALTALAAQLPENDRAAMLAQALADARAINDARQQATTFTVLAPQLPDWNDPIAWREGRRALDRALTDARASADPNSRAIALTILASLMSEADRPAVIRDALMGAYGVRDDADRAAALAALAPEIPEPGHSLVVDEACAAVSAIRDPDPRATAFTALVSKVPEALGRQALGAAQAIDTAYMRSAALAASLKSCVPEAEDRLAILHQILMAHAMSKATSPIMVSDVQCLSRLPRRKRLAVFEGGREVTCAISEVHSRATALATMTSANLQRPSEANAGPVAVEATTEAIAKVHSKVTVLTDLASELPEELKDKVLVSVRAIKAARSWAEGNPVSSRLSGPDSSTKLEETLTQEPRFWSAFNALAFPSPEPDRTTTLNEAQAAAVAIGEPGMRAAALTALIPYLTEAERVTALTQALTAAPSVSEADQRAHILDTLARHSITGPIPPWEPYWRAVIEDSATRGRAVLISDLSTMGAIISRLGGRLALEESIHGLLDVGRWWP